MTEANSSTVDRNSHIPTDEITRDIAETEREIASMDRQETCLRTMGDKLSVYRADALRVRMEERQEFVYRLQQILAARGAL